MASLTEPLLTKDCEACEPIVVHLQEDGDEYEEMTGCANSVGSSVLIMTLVAVQFGLCFYFETQILCPTKVYASAIIYGVAAFLYRQAGALKPAFFQSCGGWVLLLPEILMNIVLFMVLMDQVVVAYCTLLGATMYLSGTCIVVCLYELVGDCCCAAEEEEEKEEDRNPLIIIPIV